MSPEFEPGVSQLNQGRVSLLPQDEALGGHNFPKLIEQVGQPGSFGENLQLIRAEIVVSDNGSPEATATASGPQIRRNYWRGFSHYPPIFLGSARALTCSAIPVLNRQGEGVTRHPFERWLGTTAARRTPTTDD